MQTHILRIRKYLGWSWTSFAFQIPETRNSCMILVSIGWWKPAIVISLFSSAPQRKFFWARTYSLFRFPNGSRVIRVGRMP